MSWSPMEGVNEALRGRANGRRTDGERSLCGEFLVCRLPSTHPIRPDSWELWARSGESWSIRSSHATRERARAEADRLRALRGGAAA